MADTVHAGGMGVTQTLIAVAGAIAGAALFAWGLLETSRPIVEPEPQRDLRQRELFIKRHACPGTGKKAEPCAGYVVGYVKPLCAGGADRAANMQWQTVADAKKKESDAKKACAKAKRSEPIRGRSPHSLGIRTRTLV